MADVSFMPSSLESVIYAFALVRLIICRTSLDFLHICIYYTANIIPLVLNAYAYLDLGLSKALLDTILKASCLSMADPIGSLKDFWR